MSPRRTHDVIIALVADCRFAAIAIGNQPMIEQSAMDAACAVHACVCAYDCESSPAPGRMPHALAECNIYRCAFTVDY